MLSFVFVELVVHDTCQNYIYPVARRNYPVYTYLLQLSVMTTVSFRFFSFDSDLIGTSLAFVKEVYRVIKC